MSSTYQTPRSLHQQILSQAAPIFHTYNEISDWVSFFYPGITDSLNAVNAHKAIPTHHNVSLSSEKLAIYDHASYLCNRLNHFDHVNVVEVTEAIGTTSVPFLLSLLDEGVQTSYTSVSLTEEINHQATNNLSQFMSEAGLGTIPLHHHVAHPGWEAFKQVRAIQADTLKSTNLFLMVDSCLGNAMNPNQVLQNIYTSMESGDHFVLSQGIFRDGQQRNIVDEYEHMFDQDCAFASLKGITSQIDKAGETTVRWEQRDGFVGIKFLFTPQTHSQFAGVNISEGESFTYFRSQRFEEQALKATLEEIGFKIVEIAYGDYMDNAIFFMKKR